MKMKLKTTRIFLSGRPLLFFTIALAFACQITVAQEPTEAPSDGDAQIAPPVAGPELLNFTPEQIESAYQGKKIPEGVRMYLAIARGGKMNGSEGWFGPSQSRFTWEWLSNLNGGSQEGAISLDQFTGSKAIFQALDRNQDGMIQQTDLDWSDSNPWVQQSYMINRMFRKMDPNGDGKLSDLEWQAYFKIAAGENQAMNFEQLRDSFLTQSQGSFSPGDEPSKEILIQGLLSGSIGSLQEGPSIDDLAPDFELETVEGDKTIRLSTLVGSKPIALVFGNFTCGPFRSMYPAVDEIAVKYADDVQFLGVYVREAHPTDGWAMRSNNRVGIAISQPTTYDQKRDVATQCQSKLNMSIPLLVDRVDDQVGNAYSGMPARLYLIDTEGRVVYKGGRGPFGFKAGEFEQALNMLLMEGSQSQSNQDKVSASKKPRVYTQPRIPLLSNEEAWQRLPEAEHGTGQPLPTWARALAGTLPQTTAAMLELDYLYRTTPQFSPTERALIRLSAARINHSGYGISMAKSELISEGKTPIEIESLANGDTNLLSENDKQLVSFVEQLSSRGADLRDEQYHSVANRLGDDRMVGLVLLTAYANFQDRLVHALGLVNEPENLEGPLNVRFADSTIAGSRTVTASRPEISDHGPAQLPSLPDWSSTTFAEIQTSLEKQRARSTRITIPSWSEIVTSLPDGLYNQDKPLEIRWSRLVVGRQPVLGPAWIKCLRVFGNEAKQDRVFEESVFWVVTRQLGCFYCMGHCEMLLEVGGLDRQQLLARTRSIAEGNWANFSPGEQQAFSVAAKMTARPWDFSDQDWDSLSGTLGTDRSIDVLWWIARCQFMTKVSDTFQIQLEDTNVFRDFEPPLEAADKLKG